MGAGSLGKIEDVMNSEGATDVAQAILDKLKNHFLVLRSGSR